MSKNIFAMFTLSSNQPTFVDPEAVVAVLPGIKYTRIFLMGGAYVEVLEVPQVVIEKIESLRLSNK